MSGSPVAERSARGLVETSRQNLGTQCLSALRCCQQAGMDRTKTKLRGLRLIA